MEPSKSNQLTNIRTRALSDYFFFCKKVLGYSKMELYPHGDLCQWMDDETSKKKLVLMPRGSFKSSVITIGLPLLKLARDPNHRILIASATQKNAKMFLSETVAHLEKNQRFRALFGDWKKGSKLWRNDAITIGPRTIPKKDPSIMTGSLERGVLTSTHFDTIILDDVVQPGNVATPEQLRKTQDYAQHILSVLEPGGHLVIVGTRYSVFDLYGSIIESVEQKRSEYAIYLKAAFEPDGSMLFPQVLTREFLETQKIEQGEHTFSCQYLNEPLSRETSVFSAEDLQYFEEEPRGLYYTISLDPAVSSPKNKHADYSGITVVGADYRNNWYVMEALQLRLPTDQVIDKIFELAGRYQPLMCLGMEAFALEQFIEPIILREMERRKIYFAITKIQDASKYSKESRVRALQPRFTSKQIFLKRDQTDLIFQILHFPQLKHDDIVDALKNHLRVSLPSDIRPEEEDKRKHLTRMERKIWEEVDKLGSARRVRRMKEIPV